MMRGGAAASPTQQAPPTRRCCAAPPRTTTTHHTRQKSYLADKLATAHDANGNCRARVALDDAHRWISRATPRTLLPPLLAAAQRSRCTSPRVLGTAPRTTPVVRDPRPPRLAAQHWGPHQTSGAASAAAALSAALTLARAALCGHGRRDKARKPARRRVIFCCARPVGCAVGVLAGASG
jgi:hypothetical protein